jgi:AcrR family transcriptional regulator
MARTRRASPEIRALLLSAATELFAERGFAGTTTKEIATRAGVSETLLFRHFSSKQTLFDVAVVEPFDAYVARYTGEWAARDAEPETIIRDLVEHLYDLVVENRLVFGALGASHLAGGTQHAFGQLEQLAMSIKDKFGFVYDSRVAARAVVAMIVSTALLEDELFPSGERPGRDRMIDELTGILVGGLTRR